MKHTRVERPIRPLPARAAVQAAGQACTSILESRLTIVEIVLQDDGEFDVLQAAVVRAGLVDALNGRTLTAGGHCRHVSMTNHRHGPRTPDAPAYSRGPAGRVWAALTA